MTPPRAAKRVVPGSGPPANRIRLLEIHISSPCSNPSIARLESRAPAVTEETAETYIIMRIGSSGEKRESSAQGGLARAQRGEHLLGDALSGQPDLLAQE